MTAKLSVPVQVIGRVREGAYGVIVAASEALSAAALVQAKPERESRERLIRAWSLLERIGWYAVNDPPAVVLDAAEHAGAVADALGNITRLLATWSQKTEQANRDELRAELHELRRFERIAKRARQAATAS